MLVTFYGVRGSIPTPGNEFVKYGGNTACVHVALDDGTNIILDSGTGLRNLGKKLLKINTPIHILLSHNHWDHIQGFPFFKPLYQANRTIFITPGLTDENRPEAILEQMKGSFFPVPREAIAAKVIFKTYTEHSWLIGEAKINRLKMNHPGGGSCYTIEYKDRKLAYITDNELYPPYKKNTDFLDFVAFAKNSDLLIHDAQYITEDMPEKSGWGHSVAEEAVKLALASEVKLLALYSHDPEREDNMIDNIVEQASLIIEAGGGDTTCIGAIEGMSINL